MSGKRTVLTYVLSITSIFCLILYVMVMNKDILHFLSRIWLSNGLPLFRSEDYNLNDWNCSENYTLTQANMFQQLFSKDNGWSACYADDYFVKLHLADLRLPRRQYRLFFDIGANKGYNIASWLSTCMPETGFNQKNLYDYLSRVLKIDECGACLDCKDKTQCTLQENDYVDTKVEIYAFEPMESTYQALLQMRTWFNISRLHIYQLAISNSTGRANISKCPVGAETCGLISVGRPVANEPTFETQTITLDDFVEQNKIKRTIDLLKIDTEGADPLVLQGANKLLSQGQIRMFIFENHGIGAWVTISLLDVIESLNNKGYICYMLGKTGIARLTDCWSSVFDVKSWSNVLCVYRREKHLRRFIEQILI
jgi:FkbM family methyltransferase